MSALTLGQATIATTRATAASALRQLIDEAAPLVPRYADSHKQAGSLAQGIFDAAHPLGRSAWTGSTYAPISLPDAVERLHRAIPSLQASDGLVGNLAKRLAAGDVMEQAAAVQLDAAQRSLQSSIDTVKGALRHAETGTPPDAVLHFGEKSWWAMLRRAEDEVVEAGIAVRESTGELGSISFHTERDIEAFRAALHRVEGPG